MNDVFEATYRAENHMMMKLIQAACIARQALDHFRDGRGAPELKDMQRFNEEGQAIAELWLEVRKES